MTTEGTPRKRRRPPATTPEGREAQLGDLAFSEAERMMRNHTAPAQVVTHFLKVVSTRERLEQERLRRENLLLERKSAAMESAARMETLYEEAIEAMRKYGGHDDEYNEDFNA